jgi:hypothetical protein
MVHRHCLPEYYLDFPVFLIDVFCEVARIHFVLPGLNDTMSGRPEKAGATVRNPGGDPDGNAAGGCG